MYAFGWTVYLYILYKSKCQWCFWVQVKLLNTFNICTLVWNEYEKEGPKVIFRYYNKSSVFSEIKYIVSDENKPDP